MKQKLLTLTFALLLLSGYAQNQNALNNLVPFGGGTECLTWVDPSPTTGYTNFNTTFGGAPCNDGTGCPFNEIQGFEVWQSEAYAMANVVAGGSYTFSMCNGPGAGTWIPDFTIIGPGGIVDASGTGDGDGCSITWTASQSGAYLIVINELGNCGVAGGDDNGFPAITCNGTPDCEAPGECSAGEIANTEPQFICPGEDAIFETDGTENIPLLPGGYAIVFTPTTGTGGIDDVLTLFGVTPPYTFDNDLNGVLSANALPPFAGEWSISGFAYTDDEDLEGTLCSETSESFLVTFLDSTDPLCGGEPGDCSAGEIANTEPQFVCPGDDAIFETDGTEEIPALPGGYAIVFTPTTGTGGIDDVLTLFGVTPPYTFDNDLNGILSANALPVFEGEWSISGFAYTDEDDLEGSLCSETSESFLVTFLDSSDPLCDVEPGDCSAGEIANTEPQSVCPGEQAIFETDGTEEIPALPGGYAIVFTPTTGTGGIDDVLTLFGVTPPYNFDNDLNGVLSANALPPFAGEWSISGFAYTDEDDLEGSLCSETSESFLVTFLASNDPLCGGTCPDGEIEDCNGNCAPEGWVGDGSCDDGSFTYNGFAIFFNCEEFDNDGGDCDINDDCTSWVEPSPTTGWSDFNNDPLSGAPVPDNGVCPFIEITDFQVWQSEAYAMDNVTAETCYTFSHCNGDAGTWIPYYAIIAPSGAVDYEGLGDGDGCSVTWIASETGTYFIVINEDGNCGVAGTDDNGFPAITCNSEACLTVSVDETAASTFNIFPNPNNGQFMINYVGESGLASIEVMDVAGKVIISNQQAVTTGTRVDMNVGNVRGLYFVRITMNNQQQVHKVVVN